MRHRAVQRRRHGDAGAVRAGRSQCRRQRRACRRRDGRFLADRHPHRCRAARCQPAGRGLVRARHRARRPHGARPALSLGLRSRTVDGRSRRRQAAARAAARRRAGGVLRRGRLCVGQQAGVRGDRPLRRVPPAFSLRPGDASLRSHYRRCAVGRRCRRPDARSVPARRRHQRKRPRRAAVVRRGHARAAAAASTGGCQRLRREACARWPGTGVLGLVGHRAVGDPRDRPAQP